MYVTFLWHILFVTLGLLGDRHSVTTLRNQHGSCIVTRIKWRQNEVIWWLSGDCQFATLLCSRHDRCFVKIHQMSSFLHNLGTCQKSTVMMTSLWNQQMAVNWEQQNNFIVSPDDSPESNGIRNGGHLRFLMRLMKNIKFWTP